MVDDTGFYQQTVTTRSQVDQTCPVRSILAHIYFQRSYNKINKFVPSIFFTTHGHKTWGKVLDIIYELGKK